MPSLGPAPWADLPQHLNAVMPPRLRMDAASSAFVYWFGIALMALSLLLPWTGPAAIHNVVVVCTTPLLSPLLAMLVYRFWPPVPYSYRHRSPREPWLYRIDDRNREAALLVEVVQRTVTSRAAWRIAAKIVVIETIVALPILAVLASSERLTLASPAGAAWTGAALAYVGSLITVRRELWAAIRVGWIAAAR